MDLETKLADRRALLNKGIGSGNIPGTDKSELVEQQSPDDGSATTAVEPRPKGSKKPIRFGISSGPKNNAQQAGGRVDGSGKVLEGVQSQPSGGLPSANDWIIGAESMGGGGGGGGGAVGAEADYVEVAEAPTGAAVNGAAKNSGEEEEVGDGEHDFDFKLAVSVVVVPFFVICMVCYGFLREIRLLISG